MSFAAGDWCHSLDHSEPCRVIAVEDLWGLPTAQVWLSRRDAVVRLPVERLQSLEQASPTSLEQLSFVAAAARILDALEHDALVAPLEGSVIPLPHQLQALQRAMSGDRVRYLLADEVGLGKTIEAGLIIRELKVRGLAKRFLVVAPAGLVSQWVSELDTHFNETFHLVQPGNFTAWRQLLGVGPEENLWKRHDQVVCTLDSVKPMEARRGWSAEQVARYNRERFDDLINAGWDLVVIDEAHRLGGSTETVARFRLGEGLAQASPYLLLLSATPHQGKTDAFRRLLGFLDPDALPDDSSVTRENVAPYVIRTEKRRAINDKGEPLFQPRHTQIVSVAWDSARLEQRVLYDAVTEYVREGYNQALRDKQPAVGFLMILMQRLVTSSTAAIRTALERRLQVLELPTGQLTLFGEDVGEDWAELEGQEQLETLLNSRLKELKNERAEVELLLSAARRCEARGLDVKAQALLDTIGQLQREENDPALKVLLFTEFVPTQTMLAEVLEQRGYPVVLLNGSMNLEERKSAQRAFANEAQILISTDAGGEGLNLQFCHVIINYDLPWNPMKLEQRIGRVDRIGQTHVVRALNFALEDTVELRVREVLEEKLERILQEFGVDKLSDVLDSEENGLDFQQLYVNAVLTPEEAEARAAALAEAIRARALSAHDGASLLSSTEELDPKAAQRVAGHLMPFWTERMTLAWLQTQAEAGGQVRPNPAGGLDLHWPDGHRDLRATFSRQSAKEAGLLHLSLEEPRLRALTAALPPRAPGMTVPVLHLQELAGKVSGIWSLWRVAVQTSEGRSQRMLPLFLSSEGRLLEPTARLIWERLISLEGELQLLSATPLSPAEAAQAYDRSHQQAQQQGRPLFDELQAKHQQKLERERRKQELAFASRQRAIEQLGLPQVRDFRRAQLQQEEQQWRQEFQRRQETLPSLTLLQLVSLAPHFSLMAPPEPASSWRQPVLECFTSESATASRLTVVNDPDQLFAEPVLRSLLAERGYELLAYEDPVAFRYLFEHRCRPRWEAGEPLHVVVVNAGEASARTVLPYDLLSEARATQREFSFSLPSLFPNLDPNVLSELEPSQFDALSEALQRANPGQLGANATQDFLLNHLYGVVPSQIRQPADLLRLLLRRHLRQQQLPPLLDQRLLEQLCLQKPWREWPLERLLPNRAAFFSFVQERWPLFLQAKGCAVVPGREQPAPQLPGPELLPFDHDDIRVYIDNLFAEGLLEPTTAIAADEVPADWMRLGVVGRQEENTALRLERLLPLLQEELPGAAASHEAWELFALRWAEAQVLRTELSGSLSPEISSQLDRLQLALEEGFGDWMLQRYSALSSLPALPRPITLDKVAHFLAHQQAGGSKRLALVVVDGLALDQWLLLRDSLGGLALQESVCWAWVPTITSVSRQAIFAAEAPMFFPQSLDTTSKEPKHWERFWGDQGLLGPAVAYVRQGSQEADSELLEKVKELASRPACRALGIVVGKVDEMLHGVVTGLGGLHAQVRQWSQQGAFRTLIDSLLEQGFTVYVTADHGNVAAKGIGRPNIGTVPEEKGERAWVFRDEVLRAQVQQALPTALLWPGPGLPADYSVLLPRGVDAFLAQGKETLGHGGIALEEVLVPFVRIQEPT